MSAPSESLSEILSGSSPSPTPEPAKAEPAADVKSEPAKAEPEAAPSAAKEPEAKAEAQRDDKGRFAPKDKAEPKPEPMVPLSALLAERAKRREPEGQAKPKTSVLENEDLAFKERVSAETEPLRATVFEMSLEFARSRYDDYDEVAKAFADAANNDPRLWEQYQNARNPAMYVYQVGQQIKELAPFGGNLLKYREHVKSSASTELTKANERLAVLEAELASLKKSKADLEAVPRSLNSTGSGTQPSLADADPTDLTKLVRFGSKT